MMSREHQQLCNFLTTPLHLSLNGGGSSASAFTSPIASASASASVANTNNTSKHRIPNAQIMRPNHQIPGAQFYYGSAGTTETNILQFSSAQQQRLRQQQAAAAASSGFLGSVEDRLDAGTLKHQVGCDPPYCPSLLSESLRRQNAEMVGTIAAPPTASLSPPTVGAMLSTADLGCELLSSATSMQRTQMDPRKYKTQLCRNYARTLTCTFGDACVYAHGTAELRLPNDPIKPTMEASAPTRKASVLDKETLDALNNAQRFVNEVQLPTLQFIQSLPTATTTATTATTMTSTSNDTAATGVTTTPPAADGGGGHINVSHSNDDTGNEGTPSQSSSDEREGSGSGDGSGGCSGGSGLEQPSTEQSSAEPPFGSPPSPSSPSLPLNGSDPSLPVSHTGSEEKLPPHQQELHPGTTSHGTSHRHFHHPSQRNHHKNGGGGGGISDIAYHRMQRQDDLDVFMEHMLNAGIRQELAANSVVTSPPQSQSGNGAAAAAATGLSPSSPLSTAAAGEDNLQATTADGSVVVSQDPVVNLLDRLRRIEHEAVSLRQTLLRVATPEQRRQARMKAGHHDEGRLRQALMPTVLPPFPIPLHSATLIRK